MSCRSRIGNAVDATQHAAGEHNGDIAANMTGGATDRAAADAVVRPGLQTVIDANRAAIDTGYNGVRGAIDQWRRFIPRTQNALSGIRANRTAAGWPNPSQGLEQFENVAAGATFNGAHRARVDAREAGNAVVPHPGYNAADYNRLTRAMTADIRDMAAAATIGTAGRPVTGAQRAATVRAFDEAEREFGRLADQNGLLRRLIDPRGEGAIATLLGSSKEKGGNLRLLAQLRNSMQPADFNAIGGVLLHELGHNNSTGEFSLAKFATGWDKVSDRATFQANALGRRRTEICLGGAMQDRDSFYHRAIRTKLGEAMRAQQENVAADGKETKGLDLDDPEQRRRFIKGEL
jgi:hypothetical protein